MRKYCYHLYPLLLSVFLHCGNSYAYTNSDVLPKGRYAIAITNHFMHGISESYNGGGTTDRFDAPLNLSLDGKTLSELEPRINNLIATINELTGDRMEGNMLSAGYSQVSIEGSRNVHEIWFNYGITDRLSACFAIPIVKTQISIASNIAGQNTAASLLARYPEQPELKAALEELSNLNTQTFQDYVTELGYDPIEGYDETTLGDIWAGAKYRYLNLSQFKLAIGGALLAPTGKGYDPDKIIQAPPGNGVWGIILSGYHDCYPIPSFKTNVTIQYLLQFSNTQEMRILESGDYLTDRKETVNWDPGDAQRIIWSNTWKPTKNFYFDVSYMFTHKNRDSYRDQSTTPIPSLEEDTGIILHEGELLVGYSTIADYRTEIIFHLTKLNWDIENHWPAETSPGQMPCF